MQDLYHYVIFVFGLLYLILNLTIQYNYFKLLVTLVNMLFFLIYCYCPFTFYHDLSRGKCRLLFLAILLWRILAHWILVIMFVDMFVLESCVHD